jgi:prepilin-type N-terminal cleavage/methylation domain-containing protein
MRRGLTLIEIVITIALIVVITGIYIVAANPAGQLASSRNTQRSLHLQTIGNSVRANMADQGNEKFLCSSGPIPTTSTLMGSAAGQYNIAPCLIPTYIFSMPFDPIASSAHYVSVSDYATGYAISINASGTVITLSAPSAELGKTISITR